MGIDQPESLEAAGEQDKSRVTTAGRAGEGGGGVTLPAAPGASRPPEKQAASASAGKSRSGAKSSKGGRSRHPKPKYGVPLFMRETMEPSGRPKSTPIGSAPIDVLLATPHWSTEQMRHSSPYLYTKYERELFSIFESIHHTGYTEDVFRPVEVSVDWQHIAVSSVESVALPIAQRPTIGANMVYPPLSRHDYSDLHKSRVAIAKAKECLSKFDKVVNRGKDEEALDLLVGARMHYQEAGHDQRMRDLDAMIMKMRGDQTVREISKARQRQDYDACIELCTQALKYYKVLASMVSLERNADPMEVERREEDRNRYKAFLKPRQCAQRYALADGKKAQQEVVKLLEARKYDEALDGVKVARQCLIWAQAKDSLKVLDKMEKAIEVTRHSYAGDRLIETLASKLKPIYAKDYLSIQEKLLEAKEAFEAGGDQAGLEVTTRMRRCVTLLRRCDSNWRALHDALLASDYPGAVQALSNAREALDQSVDGLSFVNPSLDTVRAVVCNPHYSAHGMVAEIAMVEGRRAGEKAASALGKQALVEAEQHAAKAESSLSWIAETREPGEAGLGRSSVMMRPSIQSKITSQQLTEVYEVQAEEAGVATAEDGTLADGEEGDEPLTVVPPHKGSERLLQRFLRMFPLTTQPRHHVLAQAKERRRDAEEALRELSDTKHKLAKAKAHRQAIALVQQAGSPPGFSAPVAKDKLSLLADAEAMWRQHGFTDHAATISTLHSIRKADAALERAVLALGSTTGGQGLAQDGDDPSKARAQDMLEEARREYSSCGQERSLAGVRSALAMAEGQALAEAAWPRLEALRYKEGLRLLQGAKTQLEAAVAEDRYRDSLESGDELEEQLSFLRGEVSDEVLSNLLVTPASLIDALVNVRGEALIKRLRTVEDPVETVKAKAVADGQQFKAQALQLVVKRQLTDAETMVTKARTSFDWAGQSSAVDDAVEAIAMVRSFLEGSRVLAQAKAVAENATGDESEDQRVVSLSLLQQCKSLLCTSQGHYSQLMELASQLLSPPEAQGAERRRRSGNGLRGGVDSPHLLSAELPIGNGMAGGDGAGLSGTGESSVGEWDGDESTIPAGQPAQRSDIEAVTGTLRQLTEEFLKGDVSESAEVLYQCLGADMTLDQLPQLVSHRLHEDAMAKLHHAKAVYDRAKDERRLAKWEKLEEVVQEAAALDQSVSDKQFGNAVERLERIHKALGAATALPPHTLKSPAIPLLSEGVLGPLAPGAMVRKRAIQAALGSHRAAGSLLERKAFQECREAIAEAEGCFTWLSKELDCRSTVTGGVGEETPVLDLVPREVREREKEELLRLEEEAKIAQRETASFQDMVEKKHARSRGAIALEVACTAASEGDLGKAREALEIARSEFEAAGDAADELQAVARAESDIEAHGALEEATTAKAASNFRGAAVKAEEAVGKFRTAQNKAKEVEAEQLRQEVLGDEVWIGYAPALTRKDYDKAVQIAAQATEHYSKAGPQAASREIATERDVRSVAVKDGEASRREAVDLLRKHKNPAAAKSALADAEQSLTWAKAISLERSAIEEVRNEILVFELRKEGEKRLEDMFTLNESGDGPGALAAHDDVVRLFTGAGEKKLVGDLEVVRRCLECDEKLRTLPDLVRGAQRTELRSMLEESRVLYQDAAMLRASALRKLSGKATQKVEQLAKVIQYAGHWTVLGEKLEERDFFHAKEELDGMNHVLEEVNKSARVFSWSLPFPLEALSDLTLIEEARIAGRPLPATSVTPED